MIFKERNASKIFLHILLFQNILGEKKKSFFSGGGKNASFFYVLPKKMPIQIWWVNSIFRAFYFFFII